jgi:glutathione S-transferase
MPKEPYQRARGRLLVDYTLNYLHEPYWALRSEMARHASQRNLDIVASARRDLSDMLNYLEETLDSCRYFLGEFGMTDIDVWPRISRLQEFGVLTDETFPRLCSWISSMKRRPSVQSLDRPQASRRFIDGLPNANSVKISDL